MEVSADYFRVLGVGMTLGRGFLEGEDRVGSPQAVAVLSHRTWMSRFGGVPAIVGRSVRLDDFPFTVIGVAARGWTEPPVGGRLTLTPLAPALRIATHVPVPYSPLQQAGEGGASQRAGSGPGRCSPVPGNW
jgi:hypothetical protein